MGEKWVGCAEDPARCWNSSRSGQRLHKSSKIAGRDRPPDPWPTPTPHNASRTTCCWCSSSMSGTVARRTAA